MDLTKTFNINRSTFLLIYEGGELGARGNFIGELKEEDYDKVWSALLSGLKSKDLQWLAKYFPRLRSLTIEKNSNLRSLNGIQNLKELRDISIEEMPSLQDFSALSSCYALKDINCLKCITAKDILSYLPETITELRLNSVYTDIDILPKLKSLEIIFIEGYESDLIKLPVFPPSLKRVILKGFPNLADGSCFSKLSSDVYLSIDNIDSLENLPAHFKV